MSAENFIFTDFFAVKVDGSDVNPGFCKEFSEKKSMKMELSVDKIYYKFFSGESKDYKYVKFPQMLYAL